MHTGLMESFLSEIVHLQEAQDMANLKNEWDADTIRDRKAANRRENIARQQANLERKRGLGV